MVVQLLAMIYKFRKHEQWIARRVRGSSFFKKQWLKDYGFLLLAFLLVVGVIWYKGGLKYFSSLVTSPVPQGYAEIQGKVRRWQMLGPHVFALIDRQDNQTVQYIFSTDDATQYLRASERNGKTRYAQGALSEIKNGVQITVYLREHLADNPEHWTNAIVYSP